MIRNRLQLRTGVVPSSQLQGLLPCIPSSEPHTKKIHVRVLHHLCERWPRATVLWSRGQVTHALPPRGWGQKQAEAQGHEREAEMTTMALTLEAITRPGAETTRGKAQSPGREPTEWGLRWGCGPRRRGAETPGGWTGREGPLLQLQAHSLLLTPDSGASSRAPPWSLPTARSGAAPRDFKTLHSVLNSEKTTLGHLNCVLQLGLP